MKISPDVVQALAEFRKVKIAMRECDNLEQGRDLVTAFQMSCPFPLAYVQGLGRNPALLIWRFRDAEHAMEAYRVERYQC